ncbi:hypothetical protein [Brevibacterium sp. SMBL_HHYL_HB1]|uniref:hypothetical protein n=1 Tax=Brevibacterium sp. SMBL_HHYL_HB1 TaxID=2777556 RepID=UPI001BA8EBD4|nr:hypothetical protein [Brevibacterium sp. SMBL_HHYL_HB1]QUL79907.1 hypothetical protein IG171_03400 [Brevibacterium sp. SMBL_HHYL_HB1]
MKKETVDALMAQREAMQESLTEAIREVSERVWNEAVAACAEQGTIQMPENPYTVEAVERAKWNAEQWG